MALPSPAILAAKGTEHAHQCALVAWCRLNIDAYPDLAKIYAIPNGGSRGDTDLTRKIEGGKLKAEGVRSGVPDLKLPVARGGYFGLYIEMKIGRNTTSAEQDAVIDELHDDGYCVVVCWGWESARDSIASYLSGPKTKRGLIE